MLKEKLQELFGKAQNNSGCHQKCVIILTDLYKKTPEDEFLGVFLQFIECIMTHGVDNFKYTKRCLDFVSLFCADVTKKQLSQTQSHDFLTAVIEKVLQWSGLNSYDVRHNCCYFLSQVLQDVGEEAQLDISLIDDIQTSLLERMQETKNPIRLVAMAALVRLQDPQNFECPVIQAYLQAATSGSAQIRKESIQRMAPNVNTLATIKDRVRDIDPGVRTAAFHKCADIGPFNFRIGDKLMILLCGFKETNVKVKNTFTDYLLPKWLTAYEGNYLKFVEALKLLALEEDFNKMAYLSKQLIQEFYQKHPINDLIEVLPLNEEKLVDVENLTNGVTLFWSILVSILREANMDEFLSRILPELTPFCHFIDRVIKSKSSEKMDEWRFLEYQFDVTNLFEIAENFDFSDEVGRRTMHTLTTTLLQNHHFAMNLTKKLVSIAHKCSSNLEFFTNDMCQIISEIREPAVAEPLTESQKHERAFKMSEIRVKIHVLEERQNEAIQAREFQKAQHLDVELANLKQQLKDLQNFTDVEKVRVTKSDSETLCRCLDILASVLELPAVNKLTPSLMTAKDHFLVPLITTNMAEPHWRILKCLALFSIIDKATAKHYAKILGIPMVTYRAVPINNVSALIQSICSVTDLISLYGIQIFSDEDSSSSGKDDPTKRKLYSSNSEEDVTVDNMTALSIFEILLDMLDDERQEVRLKAILAMTVMIKDGFALTPLLLSKIILKWYNPIVEKKDSRLQVYIGLLIQHYIQFKTSSAVIRDAIIPTLTVIVRAPKNSPLLTVDVDNMLLFFSEVLNINLGKAEIKSLATDLCKKIYENTNDRIVPFLVKLLYRLEVEPTEVADLIEQAEACLEDLFDRLTKRYMEKFIAKLKVQPNLTVNTINSVEPSVQEENGPKAVDEDSGNTTGVLREVQENEVKKTPVSKKRRRKSGENTPLEKVDENVDETALHTIVETSSEMENMTIETCTSDKSTSSRSSNVLVPQVDSDVSNSRENIHPATDSTTEDSTSSPQKKRPKRTSRTPRVVLNKLTPNKIKQTPKPIRSAKKTNSNSMEKPSQIKRRKSRRGQNCVVVLESLKGDDRHVPTVVHMEPVRLPKSGSTKKTKVPEQDKVVVTETSDSDFSVDSDDRRRRSTRCQKKRIVQT